MPDRENYDIQKYLEEHAENYPDKEIRILNAAINTFSEKGFKSTTTSEIASRAGIAEGTIFRYFPSKEAILEKMVPLLIRIMKPKIEKPVKNIIKETEGLSLDVVFTTIICDRLLLIRDNRKFMLSVLPELVHRPVLMQKLMENVFPVIRMYMEQVLDNAKHRGEVSEDISIDMVMYQLIGFIFSYSILHGLENEEDIKTDVETFIAYAMKGWQK